MKNILEYKGYFAKIEVDVETLSIVGKIEGINDFVNFECDDVHLIETEFRNAVDDYLDFCKEVGKEPEKQYRGTFNVRVAPELHKLLANFAFSKGQSLNSIVEKAIASYVGYEGIVSKTLIK